MCVVLIELTICQWCIICIYIYIYTYIHTELTNWFSAILYKETWHAMTLKQLQHPRRSSCLPSILGCPTEVSTRCYLPFTTRRTAGWHERVPKIPWCIITSPVRCPFWGASPFETYPPPCHQQVTRWDLFLLEYASCSHRSRLMVSRMVWPTPLALRMDLRPAQEQLDQGLMWWNLHKLGGTPKSSDFHRIVH